MAAVDVKGAHENIEKKYSSDEHCEGLNSTLSRLRQHQQFCDVRLIVEGKEFPAHRAVLAGASSYFHNLFTIDMKEKREEKMEIGELKCAVMEDFLEFIYTGNVLLTTTNAVELLKAANYTNVCHLERLCEEFLNDTLSLDNCLSVHCLAEMFDCHELKKGSCDFIKKHFSKILELPEFLEMTEKEVKFYFSSDDIVVKEEEEVYDGLVKWVKHKPKTREGQFAKLFRFVRVGCLSKQFLFSTVRIEEMVYSDINCLQLALKSLTASSDQCESSQMPRDCLNNFSEVIIICGGFIDVKDVVKTKSNICFVPSSNSWCKLADFNDDRYCHSSVEMEGTLYVFGGQLRNGERTSEVSRYDSRTNCWTTDIASMPRAVSGATAVTLKGKIYVIGGGNKFETLNIVQKYSPDTNCWELTKPLTVNREDACTVSDGLNIFAIGGMIATVIAGTENDECPEYEHEHLDSCEKYDQRSDSWLTVSPMKEKRASATAAVLRQNIFVVGGCINVYEATASCEVYNIHLDTWSEIASLQEPRYYAGAAVVDNKVYLIGGSDNDDKGLHAVECYSEQKNEWQIVSQMPKGRSKAATSTLMLTKAFIDSCPKWM